MFKVLLRRIAANPHEGMLPVLISLIDAIGEKHPAIIPVKFALKMAPWYRKICYWKLDDKRWTLGALTFRRQRSLYKYC